MDERAKMLAELVEILSVIGSEHVLVGGLAVGYHGRLRATVDVDLLLPGPKLEAAAGELAARGYVVKTFPDVLRVYSPGADPASGEAIADLVSRDANPVLKAAFAQAEPATILGQQVKVVSRGGLVALKFHAAISPARRIGDRYQDIADIDRVVAKRFDVHDAEVARRIVEHSHSGAVVEFDKLIDDLKNGRPVTL
jgi:hypothetical protein